MQIKNFLIFAAMALSSIGAYAQFGVVTPLHVNGNQLNDQYGNKVVLHGVMDTPNPYFNSYRWGYDCNDNTVSACINYFDKLFTAITDTSQGAYCNIFRLHLDPCWTNDPNTTSTGSETGEANISRFSSTRLSKYLSSLYCPIAEKAIGHGLYVVVRPPGVCPSSLKVGDEYQEYLKTVWNIVSSNSYIKNNSGVISLELANEPVNVYASDGSSSTRALYDYFQPIVNIIRANGFTGIIWVPGTGYQSQYQSYSSYPIQDSNFGYAVHVYPGWYGASDTSYDHTSFINNFQAQVPVVTSKPILVSEIDWSPAQDGVGKYNEFGQWVASNYGTWGTASTSKWGNAWKAVHDYFGNISMTLSSSDDYIDVATYLNSGTVTPAFDGNPEACSGACFSWYADYAKVNYAHATASSSSSDESSSAVPTGTSMIPSFSSTNDLVPSEWKLVDNGSICSSGTASSGPRLMTFASGGDFSTGLYVRTISSSKDGYAEYGSVSGNTLSLQYGNYLVSLNAVAWTGNPYVKAEILDEDGNVLTSRIAQCTTNVNRDRTVAITNSTNLYFSFYCMTKGNYRLRITPVADAAGNTGDWQEIIIGNVAMYYQGNPLAFTEEGVVPAGWKIVDAGSQLTAGSASSGPRTFNFTAGGDFSYGLYVRQSDSTQDGYAEFGSIGGYGLTLLQGNYRLTYNAVAWQGNPYMKCEVLTEGGTVLGSQIVQLSPNVNRSLNVSTSGSTQGSVYFTAPSTGYYRFRWTPVADSNGSAGTWLEGVIGHIKISKVSANAKGNIVNAASTTSISDIEQSADHTAASWYTLQGVKLQAAPSVPGTYIMNGKIVIVR